MPDPHDAIRRALGAEFERPRHFEVIEFVGGPACGEVVNYECFEPLPPMVLPWRGEQYELFDHRNDGDGERLFYRPKRGELD